MPIGPSFRMLLLSQGHKFLTHTFPLHHNIISSSDIAQDEFRECKWSSYGMITTSCFLRYFFAIVSKHSSEGLLSSLYSQEAQISQQFAIILKLKLYSNILHKFTICSLLHLNSLLLDVANTSQYPTHTSYTCIWENPRMAFALVIVHFFHYCSHYQSH